MRERTGEDDAEAMGEKVVVAEIQDRHVFQLALDAEPPEEWTSQERHDGAQPPTNLHFSWLPLGHPRLDELVVGQGTFLDRVVPVSAGPGGATR